jgi:dihydrofolate synthase/folylpolyglutamate synthase
MANIEPEYQKTLDYLYSFVDYSLQRNFKFSPEKFDLSRVVKFAAALGNPQINYPIIHVAGTKGKGSVSALCASALFAAGHRVGLYTSPHMDDFAERIQIDGKSIPHSDLVALVDEIRPQIAAIPYLTFFEITTSLAFLYFSLQKVSAAVIEVGLGGRLDPTNICSPIVSVITSLSYDHMHLLGDTLAEIAGEKAGIIKPGIPVVISPQKSEAREVLERIAGERHAPLVELGKDYAFKAEAHSLEGQTLRIWPTSPLALEESSQDEPADYHRGSTSLSIPLLGSHQVENAATAYVSLQIARQQGLQVSEAAIQTGFRQVSWPGRFEVLQRDPPVVIDSAHNRDSALKLRQALDDYFPGYPVILVFGASEDKDIAGMFAELMPRIEQVIAVKSFHPRAADPDMLVELAQKYDRPVQVIPDVADALGAAVQMANPGKVVLVAGSIFVAAGARIAWECSRSKA